MEPSGQAAALLRCRCCCYYSWPPPVRGAGAASMAALSVLVLGLALEAVVAAFLLHSQARPGAATAAREAAGLRALLSPAPAAPAGAVRYLPAQSAAEASLAVAPAPLLWWAEKRALQAGSPPALQAVARQMVPCLENVGHGACSAWCWRGSWAAEALACSAPAPATVRDAQSGGLAVGTAHGTAAAGRSTVVAPG